MKEIGEVRKRTSGPESDPYMQYCRKLMGLMENQMELSGLKQLTWTKDLPGGVRVTVKNVHGQKEIQISATSKEITEQLQHVELSTIPVDLIQEQEKPTKKPEEKPVKKPEEEYEPYLWIGLKRISGGVALDGYQAGNYLAYPHLCIWEPYRKADEEIAHNPKRDILSNRLSGAPTTTYPLGGSEFATSSAASGNFFYYYTEHNLWLAARYPSSPSDMADADLAVFHDPQKTRDTDVFELVGIGDDRDALKVGRKWDVLTGQYAIKVSLIAENCGNHDPATFLLRVYSGRPPYQFVQEAQFTITKGQVFNYPTVPYGYFASFIPITEDMMCWQKHQDHDNGMNPHGANWWQSAIIAGVNKYAPSSVSEHSNALPRGLGGGTMPAHENCDDYGDYYTIRTYYVYTTYGVRANLYWGGYYTEDVVTCGLGPTYPTSGREYGWSRVTMPRTRDYGCNLTLTATSFSGGASISITSTVGGASYDESINGPVHLIKDGYCCEYSWGPWPHNSYLPWWPSGFTGTPRDIAGGCTDPYTEVGQWRGKPAAEMMGLGAGWSDGYAVSVNIHTASVHDYGVGIEIVSQYDSRTGLTTFISATDIGYSAADAAVDKTHTEYVYTDGCIEDYWS